MEAQDQYSKGAAHNIYSTSQRATGKEEKVKHSRHGRSQSEQAPIATVPFQPEIWIPPPQQPSTSRRERETRRDTDRERYPEPPRAQPDKRGEHDNEKTRDRDRDREKEKERTRGGERHRGKERDGERERERERLPETEREKGRTRDREKERDSKRDRDKDKIRDRTRPKDEFDNSTRDKDRDKYKEKDRRREPDQESVMRRERRAVTDEVQGSKVDEGESSDNARRFPPATTMHRRHRTEEGTSSTGKVMDFFSQMCIGSHTYASYLGSKDSPRNAATRRVVHASDWAHFSSYCRV